MPADDEINTNHINEALACFQGDYADRDTAMSHIAETARRHGLSLLAEEVALAAQTFLDNTEPY